MIEVVIQTLRLFFKVFDEALLMSFSIWCDQGGFCLAIPEAVPKVVAFFLI